MKDPGNEDECAATDPPVRGRFESGSECERDRLGSYKTERERKRKREGVQRGKQIKQERWCRRKATVDFLGKKRLGGKMHDGVELTLSGWSGVNSVM